MSGMPGLSIFYDLDGIAVGAKKLIAIFLATQYPAIHSMRAIRPSIEGAAAANMVDMKCTRIRKSTTGTFPAKRGDNFSSQFSVPIVAEPLV
jgi:hypothetical protein